MSSVKDIKKMLKGYRYSSQAAQDIHCLIENFRGLKVKQIQRFVHPNGSKGNCISLIGTIPVPIKGKTYNIPVTIWLHPNHPRIYPMVYVSPTDDMGIQQSQFVASTGQVYLPYISEWRHGSSDLTALVQIMCATFADNCPVFSKSAVQQVQVHSNPGGRRYQSLVMSMNRTQATSPVQDQLLYQTPPYPTIVTTMPTPYGGERYQPQGTTSSTRTQTPSPVQGTSSAASESCLLCEAPVDVKFEPCGHSIVCHTCAQRAKKCPECKKPVRSVAKLPTVCAMCSEDKVSVTMKPCGHVFCQHCSRRLKLCFECKAPIATKEGLRAVSGSTLERSQTESDAESTCPICLTEQRNTAFMCGHQVCSECAKKVNQCPMCRKTVSHRIHLF